MLSISVCLSSKINIISIYLLYYYLAIPDYYTKIEILQSFYSYIALL